MAHRYAIVAQSPAPIDRPDPIPAFQTQISFDLVRHHMSNQVCANTHEPSEISGIQKPLGSTAALQQARGNFLDARPILLKGANPTPPR